MTDSSNNDKIKNVYYSLGKGVVTASFVITNPCYATIEKMVMFKHKTRKNQSGDWLRNVLKHGNIIVDPDAPNPELSLRTAEEFRKNLLLDDNYKEYEVSRLDKLPSNYDMFKSNSGTLIKWVNDQIREHGNCIHLVIKEPLFETDMECLDIAIDLVLKPYYKELTHNMKSVVRDSEYIKITDINNILGSKYQSTKSITDPHNLLSNIGNGGSVVMYYKNNIASIAQWVTRYYNAWVIPTRGSEYLISVDTLLTIQNMMLMFNDDAHTGRLTFVKLSKRGTPSEVCANQ